MTDKQVGTKYSVVDVYIVSMVRLLSICRSWRMMFTRYCHDAHVSRGTGSDKTLQVLVNKDRRTPIFVGH